MVGDLGWFRRNGVDARFLGFVLVTMVGSVVLGGCVAGLVDGLASREAASLLAVPFLAMIGAGVVIPIAFMAGFVPSAVIFALVMQALVPRVGERWATRCAGVVTATVAALAATAVMTGGGRDLDGIGGLMLFVGPAAVLFAPLAVRWFYGEGR